MQTYYFHIRDDLGLLEDTEGINLPDLAALLKEVIRSANELSREPTPPRARRLEVTDRDGRTVLVTPLAGSMTSWELLTQVPATRRSLQ